jgi:hypothetical protein
MPGTSYGMSTPCPCDDCEYHDTCEERGLSCKVSRHWEQSGTPLMKRGTGIAIERVPDRDI